MKITGFNPSILTSKPDELIRLFEELGFERSHHDTAESGIVSGSVRMKYADEFRIDITSTEKYPSDKTLIRMNVDEIEEAYKLLLEHGFHNAMGDGVIIVQAFVQGKKDIRAKKPRDSVVFSFLKPQKWTVMT